MIMDPNLTEILIYQMLLILELEVLNSSLKMGTITSERSIRHPAVTEKAKGEPAELNRDACPRN